MAGYTEDGALMARMRSREKCFDELLESIPAKYYFQRTEEQKGTSKKEKKVAGLERKEGSKKGKKAKLDPANSQTILEMQAERAAEKAKSVAAPPKRPASIEEVRESLRAHISELGKQRTTSGGTGSNQRKRMKTQSAVENEEQGEQSAAKKVKRDKRDRKVVATKHDDDVSEEDVEEEGEEHSEEEEHSEDDGDGIMLGRIVGGKEASEGLSGHRKRKIHASKLLDKAEKFQDYLGTVDEEEKKRILEKKSWKDALAKATGVKVKDNPTLLKKAMKRDEKSKKKSQASWKERMDKVEADKKAKQDKRRANIKAKKDERRDQRMGVKKKKKTVDKGGKSGKQQRPGFEGKKSGFLNGKTSASKGKAGERR